MAKAKKTAEAPVKKQAKPADTTAPAPAAEENPDAKKAADNESKSAKAASKPVESASNAPETALNPPTTDNAPPENQEDKNEAKPPEKKDQAKADKPKKGEPRSADPVELEEAERRVVGWNNKHTVPTAVVVVDAKDNRRETSTRSLAFVQHGIPVIFVEGEALAVRLSTIKKA